VVLLRGHATHGLLQIEQRPVIYVIAGHPEGMFKYACPNQEPASNADEPGHIVGGVSRGILVEIAASSVGHSASSVAKHGCVNVRHSVGYLNSRTV